MRQLVQAGADKHYTPEGQEDYQEMTLRIAISDIERMTERTSLEKYGKKGRIPLSPEDDSPLRWSLWPNQAFQFR